VKKIFPVLKKVNVNLGYYLDDDYGVQNAGDGNYSPDTDDRKCPISK